MTFNLWFVVLPGFLLAAGRQPASVVLGGAVAGLLACAGAAPLVGRLSDRVGRPAVLIAACVALCLVWPTLLRSAMTNPSPLRSRRGRHRAGVALSGFVLASHLPEAFDTRTAPPASG